MHPTNQRHGKPDKLSQVHTARQAIPGFNEKTPWIKGTAEPQKEVKRSSQGKRGEQEAEERRTLKDTGNIGSQTRNILGYTHAAGH